LSFSLSNAAVIKIASKRHQIDPTAAHEEDDYKSDNATNDPEGEDMTMVRVGTWNVFAHGRVSHYSRRVFL
jgi:hypothetical protein